MNFEDVLVIGTRCFKFPTQALQTMLDFTLSRLILDTDNQILAKIAELEQKYGKVRIEYIYKLGKFIYSEKATKFCEIFL